MKPHRRRFAWLSSLLVAVAPVTSRADRAAPSAPAVVPATRASTRPADVRAAFLKLIDRPRVELKPEEQAPPAAGDGKAAEADARFARMKFTFASDADNRVPGLLYKRPDATGRRPAVIFLHGTGGRKEAEVPHLRQLADAGFVAVAIDGRYHGERARSGAGTADYTDAIAAAFQRGGEAAGVPHPFYFDTCWDVMRLVDYLQTRDDVDPARIGLMGISKGGIETYLTAAADERIAAAVPCIGVQSFRYGLEHVGWRARVGTVQRAFDLSAKTAGVDKPDADFARRFYDRVIPGIYAEFDGPVMLTLIAPRPLLVINGDSDDKTPLDGVEQAAAAARVSYEHAGAADRFVLRVQEKTGHAVRPESMNAAVAWFVTWLKP